MIIHPRSWNELISTSEADSIPGSSRPNISDNSPTGHMESCSAEDDQKQCKETHDGDRWKGKQISVT